MVEAASQRSSPDEGPFTGSGRTITVCQVIHSLHVGGAENLASRLALRLGDRFRFVFACLDDVGPLGQQLTAAGIPIEMLQRRPGIDLRCARRLGAVMRKYGVDVVHAHQYSPCFYALAARRLRRCPPVLWTEHGRPLPDYPRRKRIWFNRALLRGKDKAIGVGRAVAQALLENEGVPPARVGVIYNGIDVDRYAESFVDRAQVRAEIDVEDDDFVIVQVARLDAVKDHATALRTLEHFLRSRPEARLVLVGDGLERPAIEREIVRRGLAGQVRMLGTRNDVERLLPAADVALLTSVSEGIPLTLIEAMAARLPVVATDVGGVAEVVLPDQTGLLAPAQDDRALAACLLKLAEDAAWRQRLGAAASVRARDLFSERQMHAAYCRCYEEMSRD